MLPRQAVTSTSKSYSNNESAANVAKLGASRGYTLRQAGVLDRLRRRAANFENHAACTTPTNAGEQVCPSGFGAQFRRRRSGGRLGGERSHLSHFFD